MRIVISTIVLLALAILWGTGSADEVIFENGERLIGTFVRVEGKKLIFKSQIAGEISVDIAKIDEIHSEKLMEIILDDGTLLKGKTIKREEGTFTVQKEQEGSEQTFVKADLYEIYPSPRPRVKWSGNISAGFKSSHGSSFSEDTNVDWSVLLRTKKHRFRQSGWLVVERSEDSDGDKVTTEENFTVLAIYDYFFTKKIFGYWSERFKKDHIDDLDYRITSAWGGGYQWMETDRLNFSTFAGLGYLQEKYDSRVSNPAYLGTEPPGIAGFKYVQGRYTGRLSDPITEKKWLKDISRRNDLILQSGYHFDWKPFTKIHYLSNLTYNPSINDWGDYNLTHDSEVRASITDKIYATFKFILDYDSDPGEDSASTDTDYILGLGVKF
jgi:putative salt-induced outer membrane protein YdiY